MAGQDVKAEIHGFSEPNSTPTPWAVGLEQLRAVDTFWLSTVRPDGRPHVTPLIAVWHAKALWFTTGPLERKARNLATNSWCVLTTGRSDLVDNALDVVVEGRAVQVSDDAELEPVATGSPSSTRWARGTSWCGTGRSAIGTPVGVCSYSESVRCEVWGSARAITTARRSGRASAEPEPAASRFMPSARWP